MKYEKRDDNQARLTEVSSSELSLADPRNEPAESGLRFVYAAGLRFEESPC